MLTAEERKVILNDLALLDYANNTNYVKKYQTMPSHQLLAIYRKYEAEIREVKRELDKHKIISPAPQKETPKEFDREQYEKMGQDLERLKQLFADMDNSDSNNLKP